MLTVHATTARRVRFRGVLSRVAPWQWLCAGTTVVVGQALVRRLASGYTPQGDVAVIEERARAVFSSRPPLLNMLSTVSAAREVHHPGPLLFDLLAIPVRIGPHGVGVAVGTALINVVAVWAIAWCAWRFLGSSGATIAAVVTAVLVWSFGSDVWLDAWQPHVAMLPFLLTLVACWGFAAGAGRLGGWMVAGASFVVQTHSSYLVIVPAVVAITIAVRRLLLRGRSPDWRGGVGLVGFGLVLWLQPVGQQLLGGPPGNLAALVRSATSDRAMVGSGLGMRLVASVLAVPPWFARPGVGSSVPLLAGQDPATGELAVEAVSTVVAVVGLVGLAVVLGVVALVARRQGDTTPAAGVVVVAVAAAVGIVFAGRLPIDPDVTFLVHKLRWLWPLCAATSIVVLVGAARIAAGHLVPSVRNATRSVAIAVGAAAMVAALPAHHPIVNGAELLGVWDEAALRLRTEAEGLEGRGVLYVPFETSVLTGPLYMPLLTELSARGIPFVTSQSVVYQQYEGAHRYDGAADTTVRIDLLAVTGTAVPAGHEVIAEFTIDIAASFGDEPYQRAFHQLVGGLPVVRLTVAPFDPATLLPA